MVRTDFAPKNLHTSLKNCLWTWKKCMHPIVWKKSPFHLLSLSSKVLLSASVKRTWESHSTYKYIPFVILPFLRISVSLWTDTYQKMISNQGAIDTVLRILRGFCNIYEMEGKCENCRKQRSRSSCVNSVLTKLMSEEERAGVHLFLYDKLRMTDLRL